MSFRIDESFVAAYCRLHELGWAHSVETWRDGALAGGLYGLRVGGLFAGESMFHRVRDASKVACWATVELLRIDGAGLFDVQWTTPHLRTLGAIDIPRAEYLRRLAAATASHRPSGDQAGAPRRSRPSAIRRVPVASAFIT